MKATLCILVHADWSTSFLKANDWLETKLYHIKQINPFIVCSMYKLSLIHFRIHDEISLAAHVAGPCPGQGGGGGGLAPGQGHAGPQGDEADHEQCPGQPHHIRVSHTRYSLKHSKVNLLREIPR